MRFSNYFPCVVVSVAGAVFGGCSDPDVIYIPFGDSTASGPADRDYHEFLRTLLGQGEETFTNEASGGETLIMRRSTAAEGRASPGYAFSPFSAPRISPSPPQPRRQSRPHPPDPSSEGIARLGTETPAAGEPDPPD